MSKVASRQPSFCLIDVLWAYVPRVDHAADPDDGIEAPDLSRPVELAFAEEAGIALGTAVATKLPGLIAPTHVLCRLDQTLVNVDRGGAEGRLEGAPADAAITYPIESPRESPQGAVPVATAVEPVVEVLERIADATSCLAGFSAPTGPRAGAVATVRLMQLWPAEADIRRLALAFAVHVWRRAHAGPAAADLERATWTIALAIGTIRYVGKRIAFAFAERAEGSAVAGLGASAPEVLELVEGWIASTAPMFTLLP